MAGVYQIKGADNVIEAYTNRDVKVWAIFHGKSLCTKGDTVEALTAYLDMISEGSSAVYTLKIYEDLTEAKQVKEKTEADGSFTFMLPKPRVSLLEYEEDGETRTRRRGNGISLYQRFDDLEEKIGALQNPEPPEDNFHTILMGYLKDPVALSSLINAGRALLGVTPGNQQYQPQPVYNQQPGVQRIGHVANSDSISPPVASAATDARGMTINTDVVDNSPEARIQRLGAAIDTLDSADPLLIEHLEKLARMSQVKAQNFKFILDALDSMSI